MNNGGEMYPGNNLDSVLNPLFVINKIHVGSATPSRLILPIDNTNTSISTYELLDVSVFPNPSTGVFNIQSEEKVIELKLTDLSGKTLNVKHNDFESIDLTNFQNGIYILVISTEKGSVIKKIIKQ